MSQRSKLAVLIALAALPLIEIGVLIRLGQSIGFWRLALVVIATAILGTIVIRRVGVSMVTRALNGLEASRDGLEPILDGFLQVVAGMLLIFPGVISDAIGVALLIPPVRQKLIHSGVLKVFGTVSIDPDPLRHGRTQASPGGAARPSGHRHDQGDEPRNGVTIEGEYERLSEDDVAPERAVRRHK